MARAWDWSDGQARALEKGKGETMYRERKVEEDKGERVKGVNHRSKNNLRPARM